MTFGSELNKILLGDGIVFIFQGANIFLVPGPKGLVKDKIEGRVAPPVIRDIRRGQGLAYMGMGLFVLAIGGIVPKGAELNSIALFRALSLLFFLLGGLMQFMGKRWKIKGTQLMYLLLYTALIIAYLFLGVIDPQ